MSTPIDFTGFVQFQNCNVKEILFHFINFTLLEENAIIFSNFLSFESNNMAEIDQEGTKFKLC